MALYRSIEAAMRDKDVEQYIALLDDDYVFVRHQSGTSLDKQAMAEMMRGMAKSEAMAFRNPRCLYENDDILVEHALMDFPDGSHEAVMTVHSLRNGKIVRTETGATTLSK